MVICTLGKKTYTVDFISGHALREMEPDSKTYGSLAGLSRDAADGKDVSGQTVTVQEALDTMVNGFAS